MVLGRRIFGDFDFELLSFGLGLGAMVTGLVFSRMLADIGRDLLEQRVHPHRSWGFGIVEERDHVLCFVLFNGQKISTVLFNNRINYQRSKSFRLTNLNIVLIVDLVQLIVLFATAVVDIEDSMTLGPKANPGRG